MVCMAKDEGGLGIKNLEWFNLALLAKWRWRLLKEDKGLWREILAIRYGVESEGAADLDISLGKKKKGTSWWKGICRLGRIDNSEDWFQLGLNRKVGAGNKISFWEDVWYGPTSFSDLFPRLYSVSEDKNKVTGNLGTWTGERWEWNLTWRRPLFELEQEMWVEFAATIFLACPRRNEEDNWEWSWESSRYYSAKSAYKWLQQFCQTQVNGGDREVLILKHFWKVKAPPKVLGFSWRLLNCKDIVPTKCNLHKRNVIWDQQHLFCRLCEVGIESVDHLFLQCNKAYSVWMNLYA